MGKKHFSSLYKLISTMLLLVFVAVITLIGTAPGTSGVDAHIFFIVLRIILICALVVLFIYGLHDSCAFWILEDDRIIYRRLFGRQKVILRSEITRIHKTGIDMTIFVPCDEYIIESPQGTIRIVINSMNRRLLEEYFDM